MNFSQWKDELNQIVVMEIGLDLDDLPDAPLMDTFTAEYSPRDAFEDFSRNNWDIGLWDISAYCTDEPDTDASGQCFTDADEGL